jgi:pimeloyl-ACP methyl ester carboxylesterase
MVTPSMFRRTRFAACQATRPSVDGVFSSIADSNKKGITDMTGQPNIVLVHGAWADGSSWSAVIERLQADGFVATAPQFPMSALADDVARLREVLNRQNGPTIVVGHSYGGQIMTALGTDAPNAIALVYIAAFGLDEGESIGAVLNGGPPSPPLHTSTSTHRASPGSQRTTSSITSPPTSTRSKRRSCTPYSSPSPALPSAR